MSADCVVEPSISVSTHELSATIPEGCSRADIVTPSVCSDDEFCCPRSAEAPAVLNIQASQLREKEEPAQITPVSPSSSSSGSASGMPRTPSPSEAPKDVNPVLGRFVQVRDPQRACITSVDSVLTADASK